MGMVVVSLRTEFKMTLVNGGHNHYYGLRFNPYKKPKIVNTIINNTSKHNTRCAQQSFEPHSLSTSFSSSTNTSPTFTFNQEIILLKFFMLKWFLNLNTKGNIAIYYHSSFCIRDHSTNECQALHYNIKQLMDNDIIFVSFHNELFFNFIVLNNIIIHRVSFSCMVFFVSSIIGPLYSCSYTWGGKGIDDTKSLYLGCPTYYSWVTLCNMETTFKCGNCTLWLNL